MGTLRRECLDQVMVFNKTSLYRHLQSFIAYYHRSRTHLGLQKDTPESRLVQLPEAGRIISIPEVGGLHQRYERPVARRYTQILLPRTYILLSLQSRTANILLATS